MELKVKQLESASGTAGSKQKGPGGVLGSRRSLPTTPSSSWEPTTDIPAAASPQLRAQSNFSSPESEAKLFKSSLQIAERSKTSSISFEQNKVRSTTHQFLTLWTRVTKTHHFAHFIKWCTVGAKGNFSLKKSCNFLQQGAEFFCQTLQIYVFIRQNVNEMHFGGQAPVANSCLVGRVKKSFKRPLCIRDTTLKNFYGHPLWSRMCGVLRFYYLAAALTYSLSEKKNSVPCL